MTTILPDLHVEYHRENISEPTQIDLKELVQKNIETKMDSYLKKILAHEPQAINKVRIHLSKNSHKDTFEGTFNFSFGTQLFVFKREGVKEFGNPVDLINEAFDKAQRFIESLH